MLICLFVNSYTISYTFNSKADGNPYYSLHVQNDFFSYICSLFIALFYSLSLSLCLSVSLSLSLCLMSFHFKSFLLSLPRSLHLSPPSSPSLVLFLSLFPHLSASLSPFNDDTCFLPKKMLKLTNMYLFHTCNYVHVFCSNCLLLKAVLISTFIQTLTLHMSPISFFLNLEPIFISLYYIHKRIYIYI